ncbi:cycloartenol synthase-like [Typha angustifolia]|uniref:cycloartenol synthase-like n=1 Tax=Typha angustifolia TaxID=59011 RepID=UPI003C2E6C5E
MWRLKIAEGGGPWLRTTNNYMGRQVWEFDPNSGTADEIAAVEQAREAFRLHRFQMKQNADLIMRMQFAKENPVDLELLPMVKLAEHEEVSEEVVLTCLRRAVSRYSTLQASDGHWPGDFGGPLFYMPGLLIVLSVTGTLNTILSPEHRREMKRYLYNHQNEDGGWGFSIEGGSTMFGSVLCYVALRLLGDGAYGGDGATERGRSWILSHGGATAIPSWGKMWLSVLGVFDWSGNNPLLPEMWLLPFFLPFHPGRMWSHCRMVYLPMSYIYGKRFVGPVTPTVLELRKELYTLPYHQIDWNKARNHCAKEDLYYPHGFTQDLLWAYLHKFVEPILMHWPFSKLRQKALDIAIEYIHYEDENTQYICISCVQKVLNMLCCWIEDPNSEAFKLHLPRLFDYLWVAEDGMKMQSNEGSQLWDTVLTIQALIATNLLEEYGPTLKRAHDFIKYTQIRKDCPGDLSFWYRHISKGAWPFSSADHGWSVSDCTAEGLKVALLLSEISPEHVGEPLDARRLYDAVNIILSFMNKDGGFGSYGLTRSYAWMEAFNPSEIFEDVVIDHPCTECTSSAIQSLTSFQRLYPGHRKEEIDNCIRKAANFIEKKQEPNGSWYGSWGICFTYGIWFGVKGLVAAGRTYENSSCI